MIRWIASYPKSGNTWLRLFLQAYASPIQFDINKRLKGHIQDTGDEYLERVSPVPLEELTQQEFIALRGAVFVHMMREHDPLNLKTHCANATFDNLLPLIPPSLTERAIYMIRDPRDVAVSYASHLGQTIDEVIDFMSNTEASTTRKKGPLQPLLTWSQHVRSWTTMKPLKFPIFVLSYEGLIANTKAAFRKVLEFMEEEIDELRLARAIELTSFANLAKLESEHGFDANSQHQEHFFRRGVAGGWRDALTSAQAKRIEDDHGDVMKTWHYLETSS